MKPVALRLLIQQALNTTGFILQNIHTGQIKLRYEASDDNKLWNGGLFNTADKMIRVKDETFWIKVIKMNDEITV